MTGLPDRPASGPIRLNRASGCLHDMRNAGRRDTDRAILCRAVGGNNPPASLDAEPALQGKRGCLFRSRGAGRIQLFPGQLERSLNQLTIRVFPQSPMTKIYTLTPAGAITCGVDTGATADYKR